MDGVHSLGEGLYAEAATYGRDEKVSGVVVDPASVSVHIVAEYPREGSLQDLASRIREAVNPHALGRPVNIVIEGLYVERTNEDL